MPNPSGDIDELPDDFFNELTNENFIDEVIEEGGHESDEELLHYVSEINRIQNDINIRKQKIKETEANLKSHRHSRSRSRSSSRSKSRRHKDSKRKRSRSRTRSPHTSRHSRYDERIREKRYPLSPVRGRALRRSRSRSKSMQRCTKRSSSTHRNISFLEELAQKFAEKGQAFPEKDALLMGAQSNMNAPIPMDFGNGVPFDQSQPLIALPNFPQQQVAFPPQQNMFYGVNPMSILARNPVPVPQQQPNLAPFPGLSAGPEILPMVANPHMLPQPIDPIQSNNQKALIDRCEQAIKLIRAKDNKVPVMKFLYNRTSMVVSNSNDLATNMMNKSPLQAHSTFNATFKLNQPPNVPLKNAGLKMLPRRVKDVAQSLGINSVFLFEKMRTKELNAQITDQIKSRVMENDASKGEILIQTNTFPLPVVEMAEMGTQTAEFKCQQCTERSKRIMVNEHSQTFIRGVSIGVQTNERDYREPIVELLSRMTAAQLVAIKDFANIVEAPRPRNTDEMFNMREKLMDVYSLSQRDADAVRAAEDNDMDDTPLIERQRFRSRDRDSLYGVGPSRDFNRRSNSPRFNGNSRDGDRSSFGRNFEPNDFGNERNGAGNMIDDRQRFSDGPFPRRPQLTQDDEDEMERQRYIQMERQRELELEMNQRRYDEKMEFERNARLAIQASLQQRSNQMAMEDELRFREIEERERELQRSNTFNMGRGGGSGGGGGPINRRGRGAFRGGNRGARR
ncbi:uncharacterized protein LOC129568371 [Sitodiplosis mosellana]|uniref:uncharacterized protein LOC129568371 n=1 Tax=Sitodiplosis mosellana TaxID=263140 RepID=UPI0024445424|nr:uncharacterized protein LOC129568371 [Sitodiplosis mosellana]